jgi:uncharacterized protein YecT (DUF1311 family)
VDRRDCLSFIVSEEMKTLIRTLFFVAVIFPSLNAQEYSKALAKVEPCTVLIRTLDGAKAKGLGTGFFISGDGLLVTNAHVVDGASSAVVQLSNGLVTSVISVKAIFPDADIAILQTGLKKSDHLKLAVAKSPEKGSGIAVLGNPLGLEFSLSTGVVSGFRKTEAAEYVQFTAAISQGSSGSPVFDTEGNVIGIATMYKRDGQNLNFAVSAQTISALIERADKQPQTKWVSYDPFRDVRVPDQTEMTLGALADYGEVEKLHQQVYDEIIAIYGDDKQSVEFLRRSQRAWISFRDAQIRAIWPEIETGETMGTAERMCIPIELEKLTRQRIIQLLTWRIGIEEGDVGAGTRMMPERVQERERQLKMKKR